MGRSVSGGHGEVDDQGSIVLGSRGAGIDSQRSARAERRRQKTWGGKIMIETTSSGVSMWHHSTAGRGIGHRTGLPSPLKSPHGTARSCKSANRVAPQGFRPRVEQRYNGGTTCRGATRAVLRSGGRSSGTLADRLFRMFRSGGIPGVSDQMRWGGCPGYCARVGD